MGLAVQSPVRATSMGGLAMCSLLGGASWLSAAHAAEVAVKVLDATGKPLQGAVVYLDSAAARAQVRPMPGMDIAQQSKTFVPGVTVITVGTPVSFPNLDTVRHHVYSFSPTKVFDIKLYVGTPSTPVVFDKPGIAVLGCNIHDNMVAWTLVLETPWFGRTTAGLATLKQVPPGNYTLRAWHQGMPLNQAPVSQPLVLQDKGASLTVNLPIKVAP
jgi:plastocyanin